MTSVICHPDYHDVTMKCRSGAVLTLDVTMSHISIKMGRVVTADLGVTCPAVHVRHWALLGFIGAHTHAEETDREEETESFLKYDLPRLAAHSLLIYN